MMPQLSPRHLAISCSGADCYSIACRVKCCFVLHEECALALVDTDLANGIDASSRGRIAF